MRSVKSWFGEKRFIVFQPSVLFARCKSVTQYLVTRLLGSRHVLSYETGRQMDRPYEFTPQHFLYFLPDPQGQGSLRPTFAPLRTRCCTGWYSPEPAMRACSSSLRLRR